MSEKFIAIVEGQQITSFIDSLREMGLVAESLAIAERFPEDLGTTNEERYVFNTQMFDMYTIFSEELTLNQYHRLCYLAASKNTEKIINELDFSSCLSVKDGLNNIFLNMVKYSLKADLSIEVIFGKPWLTRKLSFEDSLPHKFAEIYALTAILCITRALSARPLWESESIFLMQNDSNLLKGMFINNPQLYLQRSCTGLSLSDDLLMQPINPKLRENRSSDWTVPSKTFANTLSLSIPLYLSEGRPSAEKTAALTGTSLRTLNRRLNEEGTSYAKLVDECIVGIAKSLLLNTQYNIVDIALAVGYPYSNHFSRMFKRVTGLSPKAYRDRMKINGNDRSDYL